MSKHLHARSVATALLVSGLCLVGQSFAATPPNPMPEALERGLQGTWKGALQYRDYQTNQLTGLDVTTQISVAPDQVTLTRLSAFDDGPKTGFVYITSVSLFADDGTHVTTATFRKGRPVELSTEDATVTGYTDDQHWTIVYHVQDMDDDKPADLRVTQTRNGGDLLAVKEVKPVTAPDSDYRFRNQTHLTLAPNP